MSEEVHRYRIKTDAVDLDFTDIGGMIVCTDRVAWEEVKVDEFGKPSEVEEHTDPDFLLPVEREFTSVESYVGALANVA